MSQEGFFNNSIQLFKSIDVCIANHWVVPATTLIYSGIDTMGWIISEQEFATKQTFINWVNNYLLPQREFKFSSIDLYAARCGVLHTQSPESSLYNKGKAKRISYAWGNASVLDYHKTIELEGIQDEVAVHLDDLHWAFRLGVADCTKEIFNSSELKSRFDTKTNKGFASLTQEHLNTYLLLFQGNDT